MKKLKLQVSLDDNDKISTIYNKVPSAFHQHHYIANGTNGITTPKKIHNFMLSPPPKDINNNHEMINAYTMQSSSTQNGHLPTQEELDNNPIYQTPVKNKDGRHNHSMVSTTLPTPVIVPPMNLTLNGGLPVLNKNPKKERKLMIVDEWALNTETEIKKSIIVSEFFKMVLEDELCTDESSDQRASSSYNFVGSRTEKSDLYSTRSVLSRSTKSPVKRNYLKLD